LHVFDKRAKTLFVLDQNQTSASACSSHYPSHPGADSEWYTHFQNGNRQEFLNSQPQRSRHELNHFHVPAFFLVARSPLFLSNSCFSRSSSKEWIAENLLKHERWRYQEALPCMPQVVVACNKSACLSLTRGPKPCFFSTKIKPVHQPVPHTIRPTQAQSLMWSQKSQP